MCPPQGYILLQWSIPSSSKVAKVWNNACCEVNVTRSQLKPLGFLRVSSTEVMPISCFDKTLATASATSLNIQLSLKSFDNEWDYTRKDGSVRRMATHNDAARQLLRHTPVKHPRRIETPWIWQSVAKTVHFASHHVVVVTLVYSRQHRAIYRPATDRQLSFNEELIA